MTSNSYYKVVIWVAWSSVFLVGCGKPSETSRDNRRLVDAILTAVVVRDPKQLTKDDELLKTRLNEGKLSQANFDSLQQFVRLAQKGEWDSAEKGLYAFRNAQAFPK